MWNEKSTILFVGYQAPGTLGRSIVDGAKTVKIFGEEIAVNARIEYIEGYSGHADQEWLLNFIYSFIKKPKHIFLVHGEPEGQVVLKHKIEENLEGMEVTIPSFGETYSITNEKVENIGIREKEKNQLERLEILEKIDILKNEITNMESALKSDNIVENTSVDEISKLSEKVKDIESQIKNLINQ